MEPFPQLSLHTHTNNNSNNINRNNKTLLTGSAAFSIKSNLTFQVQVCFSLTANTFSTRGGSRRDVEEGDINWVLDCLVFHQSDLIISNWLSALNL